MIEIFLIKDVGEYRACSVRGLTPKRFSNTQPLIFEIPGIVSLFLITFLVENHFMAKVRCIQ